MGIQNNRKDQNKENPLIFICYMIYKNILITNQFGLPTLRISSNNRLDIDISQDLKLQEVKTLEEDRYIALTKTNKQQQMRTLRYNRKLKNVGIEQGGKLCLIVSQWAHGFPWEIIYLRGRSILGENCLLY